MTRAMSLLLALVALPLSAQTPSELEVLRATSGGGRLSATRAYSWTPAGVAALGASTTGDILMVTLPVRTAVENAYVVITGAAVTGKKATGVITMAGVAIANETFAVGAQTFTWKASRSTTGEVTIGATAAAAVTNIVTAITADLATVTAADGAGDTVDLTAVTAGTGGNSLALTEASTNMTVSGAGTLTGGEDLTAMTVACGRAATAYIDYVVASSAKAAANTVYGDASGERGTNLTGYDLPSYTATTAVYCHFISTGTDLANVVSSAGRLYLTTTQLP